MSQVKAKIAIIAGAQATDDQIIAACGRHLTDDKDVIPLNPDHGEHATATLLDFIDNLDDYETIYTVAHDEEVHDITKDRDVTVLSG